MLTCVRLEHLEEIHRRNMEGLPNGDIEEEMVTDLLVMLKDMALRNELLRAEIADLRWAMNLNKKAE